MLPMARHAVAEMQEIFVSAADDAPEGSARVFTVQLVPLRVATAGSTPTEPTATQAVDD